MRAPALLSTSAPRPASPAPCDPDRWAEAGVEPSVEDLLADPLTAMVMRRDRIGPAEVLAVVERARAEMTRPLPKAAATPATSAEGDPRPATPPVPFIRPPTQWRPAPRRGIGDCKLPLVGCL
ncbi:hypothetical protein ACM64Y_20065 [Novispirillum sp. DQ9]|uniref:hypothetical protein n=1 Tax=Novispirillum sp. DQ9 TaxID=3398612 RepID=UPI003C7E68EA